MQYLMTSSSKQNDVIMDWIKQIDYLQTHRLDAQLDLRAFEAYDEDL